MTQEKNHIKIGFTSRIGSCVTYTRALLDKENHKTLHFSAIGGAIGSLVNIVEVIKTLYPGLYQVNKISSVSHQTYSKNDNTVVSERLSPKLDVTLTYEKPTTTGEGFQEPYSTEVRNKLKEKLDENREKPRRTDDFRGGFRGSRGGFRGSRGGFRGSRGGFRDGNRGGNRGFRGRDD